MLAEQDGILKYYLERTICCFIKAEKFLCSRNFFPFIGKLKNTATRTIHIRDLSLHFNTSQTQFLPYLPVNMALLPAGNGLLPLAGEKPAFGFTIDEACPIIPSKKHGGGTGSKLTSIFPE